MIRRGLECLPEVDADKAMLMVKAFAAARGLTVSEDSISEFRNLLIDPDMLDAAVDSADKTVFSSEKVSRMQAAMRAQQLCGALSRTPFSASMWDRYAANHEGFVTGYTVSEFAVPCSCERGGNVLCPRAPDALLCPVLYTNEMPPLVMLYPALLGFCANAGLANELGFAYLAYSLCFKSLYWSNEMEWRLITNTCNSDDKVVYAHMEPDSVFLGMEMGRDERRRVVDAALFMGIDDIYDMVIPESSSSYELEAKPVLAGEPVTTIPWDGVNQRMGARA